MTTYIVLLRGINVGGKNIIKMADLKRVLENLGLYKVQTYIQSGNVLFKSDTDEETLSGKIEHEIEKSFGLSVPVVLRTAAELEQIIRNCPFSDAQIKEAESASDSESLYVSLMSSAPLQEKVDLLNSYKNDSEEYIVLGQDMYLLFHNSIRNSKLANNLQKLDVTATVRNWKTINKLASLANDMND